MRAGAKLRLWRMANGLEQAALAKKLKVSNVMVSHLERGARGMSVEVASKMARLDPTGGWSHYRVKVDRSNEVRPKKRR